MARKKQASEEDLLRSRIKEILWFGSEYDSIPAITKHGIENYITNGQPPSGFLEAVFQNNLFRAVSRADESNVIALPVIVKFIWNNAPSECHGTTMSVSKWVLNRGI